jgi:hypothetical protein
MRRTAQRVSEPPFNLLTTMKTVFIITHQGTIAGVHATFEGMQTAVASLATAYNLTRVGQSKEAGLYKARWLDRKGFASMTVAEHVVS